MHSNNPIEFHLESEDLDFKHQLLKLESSLQIEQIKNKVLTFIIESQTNIKVSDIFSEKNNSIHIYNDNIPIIFHDYLNGKENITETTIPKIKKTISPSKKEHKDSESKIRYRSLKNQTELGAERGMEQIVEEIDNTNKNIESKRRNLLNKDPEKISKIQDLDQYFKSITDNKSYTAPLKQLVKKRAEIMPLLQMEEYIKLIQDHVSKIDAIFVSKKYDSKKRTSIISKGLSPFESRLISYGKYDQTIHTEDRQSIKEYFEITTKYPKEYVPFLIDNCSKKFYNYSCCLFTIKECFQIFLFNIYKFYNIIYMPNKKSKDTDLYSFYTLEKIEDGKRYWSMDCRLEETSLTLSNAIKTYCISLYRNIYHNIFADNQYRHDYHLKSNVAEYECGQLAQNIILLSSIFKTSSILRKAVKDTATLTPTEKDKFDLLNDDKLQLKRFANIDVSLELESGISSIRQMFDGISRDDSIHFYNKFTLDI
jgi:hypothetical protein